jgi:UDP-2,4-diacetamido-2,4,6-trideoxy-beta-L-altropyranose hydrolase
MEMKVAIRVDASPSIGAGHLMRCVALAEAIRRHGGTVRFVSRKVPADLALRIEAQGFSVHRLSVTADPNFDDVRDTAVFIEDFAPDWLVVDHYELGREWELALRPLVKKILAIDDVARPHECDLLIDQNWYGAGTQRRYADLVPRTCRQLLGPRYALLRSEYADLRESLPHRAWPPNRVLISFGGSDPTNETEKALAALSRQEFSHIIADIAVGPAYDPSPDLLAAAAKRPNTHLHRNLSSLAQLMRCADYALGAAGITTWERLCLNLPSAVVAVAENQEDSARALATAGYVRWIGRAAETTETDYARALVGGAPVLDRLPELIDGHGSTRCTEVMFESGG